VLRIATIYAIILQRGKNPPLAMMLISETFLHSFTGKSWNAASHKARLTYGWR
jgi:hypothetical protein